MAFAFGECLGSCTPRILDELFKGAIIRTSFGGTTIDLRHTHIAPGETYIDLDCSWGGVEIYVPSDWTVVFKCNAFLEDVMTNAGKMGM